MAKRRHVSSETVYFTEEGAAQFEAVRDHFGRNRSASDVIRQLVEDKHRDIENGETRRDQVKALRIEIDAMRQEIAGLRGSVASLVAAVARLEARNHV